MLRPSKTKLVHVSFDCHNVTKNKEAFMNWMDNAEGEVYYYSGTHSFYYFVEKPNFNYLKELKAYFIAKRATNVL